MRLPWLVGRGTFTLSWTAFLGSSSMDRSQGKADNHVMGMYSASRPELQASSRWWETIIGRRAHRLLAWSAWLVCLVALLSFVPTLQEPTILDVAVGLSWTVGVMAVATIGALVVSEQRGVIQGWLLVAFAVFWSAGLLIYNYLRLPAVDPSANLTEAQRLIAAADSLIAVGSFALLLLLVLVPTGRLPSPRWQPILWLLGASMVTEVWIAFDLAKRIVDVDAWLSRSSWISEAGTEAPTNELLGAILVVGALVTIGLVIRVLWSRLREAARETRQQVKWVLWGSTGIAGLLLIWVPEPDDGWLVALQRLSPGFALVLLATGFGMALFKYRLWDIDLVVRRSVVYGVLWLLIAMVYAGVAAGLGLAAGARFPVGVAIGLTVAATLLFQPARRWLERLADRWVFGRKDSPAEVLHTFGEGVAASTRPHDIASEVATTAAVALGLAWAAVEVDGAVAAETGARNTEPEVLLPVAWGAEHFGTLRCRPQRGVRLNSDDIALLEVLAGQAALALSHARLASRIVHAQGQERRRIERNIHDGAQQDLATLVARLGVTRARANGDSTLAEALAEIQQDVQRILAELRELAQGIHPSVLRDGGLVAAIEDRCSRLPVEVNLEIDRALHGHRLPVEVEAAAYFFTVEAVANTLKHSGSSSIAIAIDLDGDHLRVRVTDRGIGFDPSNMTAGSGIAGLSDRIRAAGGRMTLDSQPEHGTVLVADLPVQAGVQASP
jgi:signal transduction histidine kinase